MAVRDQIIGVVVHSDVENLGTNSFLGSIVNVQTPNIALRRQEYVDAAGQARAGAILGIERQNMTMTLRTHLSEIWELFGTDREGGEAAPALWTARLNTATYGHGAGTGAATQTEKVAEIRWSGTIDTMPPRTISPEGDSQFAVTWDITYYEELVALTATATDATAIPELVSTIRYDPDNYRFETIINFTGATAANTAPGGDNMEDHWGVRRVNLGLVTA